MFTHVANTAFMNRDYIECYFSVNMSRAANAVFIADGTTGKLKIKLSGQNIEINKNKNNIQEDSWHKVYASGGNKKINDLDYIECYKYRSLYVIIPNYYDDSHNKVMEYGVFNMNGRPLYKSNKLSLAKAYVYSLINDLYGIINE